MTPNLRYLCESMKRIGLRPIMRIPSPVFLGELGDTRDRIKRNMASECGVPASALGVPAVPTINRHAAYADYLATSKQWQAYLSDDGLVTVHHGEPDFDYIRRSNPGTREEAWTVARVFVAWVEEN